jgi:HAE1 family hydrophobic/amphiphilic exporter-1
VIKKIKVKVLVLGIALLAAIILVYLVMVGLYDSFIHPFVVLFAIPLSFNDVSFSINQQFIEYLYNLEFWIGLVCKMPLC